MLSHFLHSLGSYTRRAIFPETRKIKQSSVGFFVNLYDHFDLIGWLDSHRPICFYGGGAKVTEHHGLIQEQFSRKGQCFSNIISHFNVYRYSIDQIRQLDVMVDTW